MSMLSKDHHKNKGRLRLLRSEAAEMWALIGLLSILVLLFVFSARTINVTVDGVVDVVNTHRRDVTRLLLELDLSTEHANVTDEAATALPESLAIQRPRSFHLSVDGRNIQLASFSTTASELLKEAGIEFDLSDRILTGPKVLDLNEPLPAEVLGEDGIRYGRAFAWDRLSRDTLQLRLQRSVPVTVQDAGLAFDLRTTAQTVGEALRDAKITLYLGDRVQPDLGSSIGPGLLISIQRSTPVSLSVDGSFVKTRSRAQTVADLLSELKVGLAGLDVVTPPLDTELTDNIAIEVARVSEDVEIEEEIASFETVFEPDPNLPIDNQRVLTPGAEGITRTRHRVRYEEGEAVSNTFEDRWVAQEPAQRTIAYGTGIEPKTFVTDDGQQLTYWRKILMRASSYSAGTAGLAPDHPWYGQTYSGEPMRGGIVAVDPSIIPLRSQVYVPGYGMGDALDTGSAIRARRIDLGYDDENLELWSQWVDVYLLWPPPPDYQITWVLPNWPRVPQ